MHSLWPRLVQKAGKEKWWATKKKKSALTVSSIVGYPLYPAYTTTASPSTWRSNRRWRHRSHRQGLPLRSCPICMHASDWGIAKKTFSNSLRRGASFRSASSVPIYVLIEQLFYRFSSFFFFPRKTGKAGKAGNISEGCKFNRGQNIWNASHSNIWKNKWKLWKCKNCKKKKESGNVDKALR